MKTQYIKSLMISGISVTTNKTNEMSEETEKISQLWEDYSTNNVYSKTFNKANNVSMYGVYSNYKSLDNGDFDVTVGVEVTKNKNAIEIKDQKYLLFSNEGELPEVSFTTWKEIEDYFKENTQYERAFKIDFEKYSKEDEIEIYISVK